HSLRLSRYPGFHGRGQEKTQGDSAPQKNPVILSGARMTGKASGNGSAAEGDRLSHVGFGAERDGVALLTLEMGTEPRNQAERLDTIGLPIGDAGGGPFGDISAKILAHAQAFALHLEREAGLLRASALDEMGEELEMLEMAVGGNHPHQF